MAVRSGQVATERRVSQWSDALTTLRDTIFENKSGGLGHGNELSSQKLRCGVVGCMCH